MKMDHGINVRLFHVKNLLKNQFTAKKILRKKSRYGLLAGYSEIGRM